jgi:uncharacterized repeat protein (TIGR04052 family)
MHHSWKRAYPLYCTLHFSIAACACSAPDEPFPDADVALPRESEPGSPPEDAGARRTDNAATPDTREVHLRFRASVAGEPFACGTTYVSSSGVNFTPADLRLFVQDVALVTADGREQAVLLDVRSPWQIENVALLDFEDASGACLAGTRNLNLEVIGNVPRGDYRGLAFTNGVPEVLNHADPSQLPPPLQAGSMSWGWLLGYRFLMAEVTGTGTRSDAAAPGSALLHVGSTACSGTPGAGGIACSKPNRNRVRLAEFDSDVDAVVIDVAELFAETDLGQVTTCHSSGAECAPFFERVGLDLELGSATERQRIYRVEPITLADP